MAVLDQIRTGGTTYEIQDTAARTDTDGIKNILCQEIATAAADWAQYTIASTNGARTANTARITLKALLDGDGWIRCSDTTTYQYGIVGFKKSDGTYDGYWDGTAYVKGIIWLRQAQYYFPDFDHRFLVVLRRVDNTDLLPSAGVVITVGRGRCPGQDVGFSEEYGFEKGGVNGTDGSLSDNAQRARSELVPIITEGHSSVYIQCSPDTWDTYSFNSLAFYNDGTWVKNGSASYVVNGVMEPLDGTFNQFRITFKRKDDGSFTDQEVAAFSLRTWYPYELSAAGTDIHDLQKRVAAIEDAIRELL